MAPPEKRKETPADADEMLAEAVENARRKAAVRTKTLWAEDPQARVVHGCAYTRSAAQRCAALTLTRRRRGPQPLQGPKGLPELNYGTKDDAREILVSKGERLRVARLCRRHTLCMR